MCGIAGMFGKEIDFRNEKEMIWKMSNSLKERGPDERGEYAGNFDYTDILLTAVVIPRLC